MYNRHACCTKKYKKSNVLQYLYDASKHTDLCPKLKEGFITKIFVPLIKCLGLKRNEPDSEDFDLEDEDTSVTSLSAINTATVSLKNK